MNMKDVVLFTRSVNFFKMLLMIFFLVKRRGWIMLILIFVLREKGIIEVYVKLVKILKGLVVFLVFDMVFFMKKMIL